MACWRRNLGVLSKHAEQQDSETWEVVSPARCVSLARSMIMQCGAGIALWTMWRRLSITLIIANETYTYFFSFQNRGLYADPSIVFTNVLLLILVLALSFNRILGLDRYMAQAMT